MGSPGPLRERQKCAFSIRIDRINVSFVILNCEFVLIIQLLIHTYIYILTYIIARTIYHYIYIYIQI